MAASRNEIISALKSRIQEAITVFDEQGKRTEAVRQQAVATRENFSRFMENWQSQDADSVAERKQLMRDLQGKYTSDSRSEERETSTQLSIRWVEVFCDIDDALMHLYAFPECRDGAEHTAQIVREIRLLQVERIKAKIPQFSAPGKPTGEVSESTDISLDRVARKEQILQFMGSMDTYHEQVQKSYEQIRQRTREMLQEAHLLAARLESSFSSDAGG